MNKVNALALKFFSEDCDEKEVSTLYLAIDYSKKTEWVDRHGRTVAHTYSWNDLLQFMKKNLMKFIP